MLLIKKRRAFLSAGGALPPHLYGQASDSPIHLVDLHFTICLLAGVSETACRDDNVPGVPPIDGVDLRAAFEAVNVTRPVAKGIGPSAGTQEIGAKNATTSFAPFDTKNDHFTQTGPGQTWGKQHSKKRHALSAVLSTNTAGSGGRSCNADLSLCGAFIDFNLSNGGPWKFVQNTTTVVRNVASPVGSGYWTPAVWPRDGNNHTPSEVDPGCPEGGCLFNLRLDRTERKEFSR